MLSERAAPNEPEALMFPSQAWTVLMSSVLLPLLQPRSSCACCAALPMRRGNALTSSGCAGCGGPRVWRVCMRSHGGGAGQQRKACHHDLPRPQKVAPLCMHACVRARAQCVYLCMCVTGDKAWTRVGMQEVIS